MPKVKVIWVTTRDLNDYDVQHYMSDSGEWEEITEEEVAHLKKWKHMVSHPSGDWNMRLHLVEYVKHDTITDLIKQIDAKLEAETIKKVRELKATDARKKASAITAKKRKQRQFEKLKKELEG